MNTTVKETSADRDDLDLIYANGFTIGLGIGDVLIELKRNDNVFAKLNLSYTLAKTLVVKLGNLVDTLEKATGNEIMTTDDVISALNKNILNNSEKGESDESSEG